MGGAVILDSKQLKEGFNGQILSGLDTVLHLLRDYSPADDGLRPGMETLVQTQFHRRYASGIGRTPDTDGVLR